MCDVRNENRRIDIGEKNYGMCSKTVHTRPGLHFDKPARGTKASAYLYGIPKRVKK